jgi:hypothetical protein
MNVWKKILLPVLSAVGSVGFLIAAVAGRLIEGEPLNYTFLTFAIMFFMFAVLFFAIGRKSGGGSGPPSV